MDQSPAAHGYAVLDALAQAEANALRSLGKPDAKEYNSFEALRAECDRIGVQGGFELVVTQSKPHYKKLSCGRAGTPDDRNKGHVHESKQRRTGSKKCECPFAFKASEVKSKATSNYSGKWKLSYDKDECEKHNHESIHASGLACHRTATLSQHQQENINLLIAGGVSTKHIKYNHISTPLEPGAARVHITSKDISNIRKKRRAEGLEGLTPIMALLKVNLL